MTSSALAAAYALADRERLRLVALGFVAKQKENTVKLLALALLLAAPAFARETCRVAWISPAGNHSHGRAIPCDDAWAWATSDGVHVHMKHRHLLFWFGGDADVGPHTSYCSFGNNGWPSCWDIGGTSTPDPTMAEVDAEITRLVSIQSQLLRANWRVQP